jgi:hypothetical protein
MRQTPNVEPWVAPAFGVAVVLAIVRHLGARRFARGDRRYAWVVFAPTLAGLAFLVVMSFHIWTFSPPAAVFAGLVGATSLILLVRVVRQTASTATAPEAIGELSSQGFDYIVWMAIGLPFLFVVFMLVALVTGAFGSA